MFLIPLSLTVLKCNLSTKLQITTLCSASNPQWRHVRSGFMCLFFNFTKLWSKSPSQRQRDDPSVSGIHGKCFEVSRGLKPNSLFHFICHLSFATMQTAWAVAAPTACVCVCVSVPRHLLLASQRSQALQRYLIYCF